MAQNGPESASFVSTRPKTKNGPHLGLGGSKTDSEGTQFTCNPPFYVVSTHCNCPMRILDPRTSGHLVQLGRAWPGPMVGQRGPRGEKMIFYKVVPRPPGMLKQVFLARFEPVVPRFGLPKIPRCLEKGPFWDQRWVKNVFLQK